jgi:hypothetical protein
MYHQVYITVSAFCSLSEIKCVMFVSQPLLPLHINMLVFITETQVHLQHVTMCIFKFYN